MTHPSNQKIICRHKETGNIYEHVEDVTFRNVVNEKTKALTRDEAKLFVVSMSLTNFANKNQHFLKLIKAGMLSVESCDPQQ